MKPKKRLTRKNIDDDVPVVFVSNMGIDTFYDEPMYLVTDTDGDSVRLYRHEIRALAEYAGFEVREKGDHIGNA